MYIKAVPVKRWLEHKSRVGTNEAAIKFWQRVQNNLENKYEFVYRNWW
jgi:hypothetical protein